MEDMKIRKAPTINKIHGYASVSSTPKVASKPAYVSAPAIEATQPVSKPIFRPENTYMNSNPKTSSGDLNTNTKDTSITTKSSKLPLVIIIILLIACGTYWLAEKFQKATVAIEVKHSLLNLNQKQFTASKTGDSSVGFEIIINPDKEYKNVTLTQPQDVSIKAKGTVVLYNEYTTKPQKIIAGTFVEDSAGRAYTLDKAVTIPGYKTDNGKIIPGQTPVGVTAFLDGDTYNGNPTDFIITAFKNTPKSKKIYGKASTPIAGGAKGVVYKLDPNKIDELNKYASSTFQNNLYSKISSLIPKGYVLYPDATTFSYQVDSTTMYKTSDAKVAITGTISAILLKESDLNRAILKTSLPALLPKELSLIQIPDLSKLSFSFVNSNQAITKDMQSVSFTLTGDLDAIWHPDIESLKTSLVGASKEVVPIIFKQNTGIASASVKIFPVWHSNLPNNISKIDIITK